MNAIELSIFSNRIESVCDEMGAVLCRAAFSPNIKDRLDFSCAIFDLAGELSAQAAHIPVHLGSMAFAMRDVIKLFDWHMGDMVVFNDPYLGGTHLPDVTLVSPVFLDQELIGFVANRAHHADIGADAPGSMPLSTSLTQEGVLITPQKIMQGGELRATFDELMSKLNHSIESTGDFNAQISANLRGLKRLEEVATGYGKKSYLAALEKLNQYGERLMKQLLATIPSGKYHFLDLMDNDGLGANNIPIQVSLIIEKDHVIADFKGTHKQVEGNINCPLSVAAAAVYYAFRCLMPVNMPACSGVYRLIDIQAPKGCLVNAIKPAAVAAGNVETSTRMVDVVLGALAQAIPEKIPAASHGSMNNVAMGQLKTDSESGWNYYETIGGGMGAGRHNDGVSAVQTHMTNTLNTPIESLEMHYPLRLVQYTIRDNLGGEGLHSGGAGLCREFEFLAQTQLTLLTERRKNPPWGVGGAENGALGVNSLNGKLLPAKISLNVSTGDRLKVETPGGGGWGVKEPLIKQ